VLRFVATILALSLVLPKQIEAAGAAGPGPCDPGLFHARSGPAPSAKRLIRPSIAVNGACPDLANGHSQAVRADRAGQSTHERAEIDNPAAAGA